MLLFNGILLGICLLYGLGVAWLFNNGENFNQLWIWWTFITFTINHMLVTGKIKISCYIEEDDEEDE